MENVNIKLKSKFNTNNRSSAWLTGCSLWDVFHTNLHPLQWWSLFVHAWVYPNEWTFSHPSFVLLPVMHCWCIFKIYWPAQAKIILYCLYNNGNKKNFYTLCSPMPFTQLADTFLKQSYKIILNLKGRNEKVWWKFFPLF